MGRPRHPESENAFQDRLIQWRQRIIAALKKTPYWEIAEDVADEKICRMLNTDAQQPSHPSMPLLSYSGSLRQEMLRIALRIVEPTERWGS